MRLVLAAIVFAGFLIGIVVLKLGELAQLRRTLVAYELRFPRGLDADDVVQLLAGVSGFLPPWWRRWLVTPYVIFEVSATERGIDHYVGVPQAWAPALENLLQASLPGVRYEPLAPPKHAVKVAVEYRLSTSSRALRVDAAALSATLLASLQPLRAQEAVVVQWVLAPAAPVAPPRVIRAGEKSGLGRGRGNVADAEAATALKVKQAHPLLLGVARIGVSTKSAARARQLVRQVEVAWRGMAPAHLACTCSDD